MPHYEVTFMMKSMLKPQLVEALKRSAIKLLDHGAIITKMESLGHRDLPFKMTEKPNKTHHYSANYFLMDCYLPQPKRRHLEEELERDNELLRYYFSRVEETLPTAPECTLEDELLPPAVRPSVHMLKKHAKMGHFARRRSFEKARKSYRFIAKSFPIAPHVQ